MDSESTIRFGKDGIQVFIGEGDRRSKMVVDVDFFRHCYTPVGYLHPFGIIEFPYLSVKFFAVIDLTNLNHCLVPTRESAIEMVKTCENSRRLFGGYIVDEEDTIWKKFHVDKSWKSDKRKKITRKKGQLRKILKEVFEEFRLRRENKLIDDLIDKTEEVDDLSTRLEETKKLLSEARSDTNRAQELCEEMVTMMKETNSQDVPTPRLRLKKKHKKRKKKKKTNKRLIKSSKSGQSSQSKETEKTSEKNKKLKRKEILEKIIVKGGYISPPLTKDKNRETMIDSEYFTYFSYY